MRTSTMERRIKEGKRQPKEFIVGQYGTKIQFVEAWSEDYLSYLRFEDSYGRYLGSLDPEEHRKNLRQLQRWVNKILKES